MITQATSCAPFAILDNAGSHWIEQLRNAALLTLDEQIECCDAVLEIWKENNNLASAESCARIAIALKMNKYGYNSLEVAEAILRLADISERQGKLEFASMNANQSDAILNVIGSLTIEDEKPAIFSKERRAQRTRLIHDLCLEPSACDFLNDTSWEEVTGTARSAINKLFAA